MTEAEMNTDLSEAENYLSVTSVRVDRCRHATVTDTALWFFGADGKQIGSASRVPNLPDGKAWKANRMAGGLPTSEVHVRTLLDAIGHIMRDPATR